MKYTSVIVISILLTTNLVKAQDTLRTPFFPYQVGDTLVYKVVQNGARYDDSRLTFVDDSAGPDGKHFYFIETEGYRRSLAAGFMVDTLGNVYARNWWQPGPLWKVFNPSKQKDDPWVVSDSAQGLFGDFEMGNVTNIDMNDSYNLHSEVRIVNIYNADSTDLQGNDRNTTLWKAGIGITRIFNFESGPVYTLKGGVIDGQVYGDTTFFQLPQPGDVQKDYFPYQTGDVVVFSVRDSTGASLPDSRMEFMGDSVGADGSTYYQLDTQGYTPVAAGFKVDTENNVYARGWWDEDRWKVFEAYTNKTDPWIVFEQGDQFVLGEVDPASRWVFGQHTSNLIEDVYLIEYYTSPDSSAKPAEGNKKNKAEWTRQFGIIHKQNYEIGLTYDIKGAVIGGDVHGDTSATITGLDSDLNRPSTIELHQNYPNPFNPSTTIRFSLNKPTTISITIYTVNGQVIQEVVQEQAYSAGRHGIKFNINNHADLTSGIYFYELRTPTRRMVNKMTLIK